MSAAAPFPTSHIAVQGSLSPSKLRGGVDPGSASRYDACSQIEQRVLINVLIPLLTGWSRGINLHNTGPVGTVGRARIEARAGMADGRFRGDSDRGGRRQ